MRTRSCFASFSSNSNTTRRGVVNFYLCAIAARNNPQLARFFIFLASGADSTTHSTQQASKRQASPAACIRAYASSFDGSCVLAMAIEGAAEKEAVSGTAKPGSGEKAGVEASIEDERGK